MAFVVYYNCKEIEPHGRKRLNIMANTMVYLSKRGKKILFDDFVDNTEEYNSYWVEMCPSCHNKYKGILGQRASAGAMGTCSVKGCEKST